MAWLGLMKDLWMQSSFVNGTEMVSLALSPPWRFGKDQLNGD